MKFIKDEKLNSYYFLFGDNEVFKTEFIDEIKDLLKDEISDTTTFIFDLTDKDNSFTVNDIIEKTSTPSFFSKKNLIIIKEFHKLLKEEMEKLFYFLKDIPEFSNVILTSSVDRNEFKKSAIDEISDKYVFNFSNKNLYETKIWVQEYLKKYKKSIDTDILQYIIEESNTDMSLIKNEIDKILLWIGDRNEINKEDFNMLRGGEKEYSIWALTDAIGFKDENKTFAILEKIFDDFEPEVILGSIFQTIKKIYMVRYYVSKNNPKKALEVMYYNSKALEIVKKQVVNFINIPFVEILNIIMEADRKVKKSGPFNAKIAIYVMLERIFLKLNEKDKDKSKLIKK
jgi:DNA polymerase-3 subunit delta